jgi:hypothetical protein
MRKINGKFWPWTNRRENHSSGFWPADIAKEISDELRA